MQRLYAGKLNETVTSVLVNINPDRPIRALRFHSVDSQNSDFPVVPADNAEYALRCSAAVGDISIVAFNAYQQAHVHTPRELFVNITPGPQQLRFSLHLVGISGGVTAPASASSSPASCSVAFLFELVDA